MLVNSLVSHSARSKHHASLLDRVANGTMASLKWAMNSEGDEISMSHLLDHS